MVPLWLLRLVSSWASVMLTCLDEFAMIFTDTDGVTKHGDAILVMLGLLATRGILRKNRGMMGDGTKVSEDVGGSKVVYTANIKYVRKVPIFLLVIVGGYLKDT